MVGVAARRCVQRHGAQQFPDLTFAQWLAFHTAPAFGHGVFAQKLDGADTIAPDRREQREDIGASRLEAAAQAFANALVVGQQVVEEVRDDLAANLARRRDRHDSDNDRTLSDCSQASA